MAPTTPTISPRLESGSSSGDETSSQDTCSGAIRVLEGLSVAHLLLSYGTQAQWAWLLLNVVSSALVIGTVLTSVPAFSQDVKLLEIFNTLEVVASFFFFFEYFLRIFVHRKRCCAYATSFLGVIDLLVCMAAVPTIYERFADAPNFRSSQSHTYHVLSCFRMLRVLKLLQFVREYQALTMALRHELRMIIVFLFAVFTVVLILGTCLYAAERFSNPDSPFDSIPAGMWWAAVTITTVGYGDLVPETYLGKMFAMISMLIGYGLLAVPTIVGTLEINHLSKAREREATIQPSYFQAPGLQEPLLGEDDMIRLNARNIDCDSKGRLKLSAGYSLLEEVVCLWMEKRYQKGIQSCGLPIEHRFLLFEPNPLPSGRALLAKVEAGDTNRGLGAEVDFLISIFSADFITCKIAEGYMRYETQSSKNHDLL